MGGMLGIDVSLENLFGTASRNDFRLYSESQGRVVVTVAPECKDRRLYFKRKSGSSVRKSCNKIWNIWKIRYSKEVYWKKSLCDYCALTIYATQQFEK